MRAPIETGWEVNDMAKEWIIRDGVLERYQGMQRHVGV